MVWQTIPYALFPLVEVSTEKIDELLKEAVKGADVNCFWLARETYEDAPEKKENQVQQGDKPPIDKKYKSPFVNKKVEDVADWLRNKPNDVDLDPHHFAILDKTAESGNIVICRIGGTYLKDQDDLDYMRFSAMKSALVLRGSRAYTWEEEKENVGQAKIEY